MEFLRPYSKLAVLAVIAAMLLAGFKFVLAAFNPQINYQGKLTDTGYLAVEDGNYNMRFRLCAASDCTGGSDPLWTETRTMADRVPFKSGLFSVLLGEVTSLAGIDFNQTLYLEVSVGGTADVPAWETLTPRKKIGAVPAAFESQELGGYTWAVPGSIGATNPNSGAFTTLSSIYGGAATAFTVNQSGAGWLADIEKSGESKFMIDNGGNVGIGTTAPNSALEVNGIVAVGSSINSTRLNSSNGPRSFNLIDANANARVWRYSTSSSAAASIELGIGTNDTFFNNKVWALGSYYVDGSFSVFKRTVGADYRYFNIDTNGNVGIGTTAPAEILDVNGRLRLAQTSAPTPTTDRLYNLSGNLFWNGTNLTGGGALPVGTEGQMIYNNAGSWTAFDGIHWDDANSWVGIGTTAPNAQLDIRGDIFFGFLGSSKIGDFGTVDTYLVNENSAGAIRFAAGNAIVDQMTILSNGNVGIGSIAPGTKLDIKDATNQLLYAQRTNYFDFVKYKRQAGAWTDITGEAKTSYGTVSGDILDAVGDAYYAGKIDQFSSIYIDLGTAISSGATLVWEYSRGSDAWSTLTVTDGTGALTADGAITFTPPGDWMTDSQDSSEPLYFVRCRVIGGPFTTEPTVYLTVPGAGLPTMEVFANGGDTIPALRVGRNGDVQIGTNSSSASYRLYVSGGVAAGGGLSATSGAFTSTVTSTVTEGYTVGGGHVHAGGAATAAAPQQNSPTARWYGYGWDGSASDANGMEMYFKPYPGAITSGRLSWKNYYYNGSVTDNTVGMGEVMNIDQSGNLNVLGTTYGDEVLNNPSFTSGTQWTAGDDYALSSNNYLYTHSSGSGTLTQLSVDFAIPLKASTWYKFSFVNGSSAGSGIVSYIGTEVANEKTYFTGSTTEITIFFKTNSNPGDFVIYTNSTTAATTYRLDDVSLKEVQGGSIATSGLFTGGGPNGIKIDNQGNVGIGTTAPGARLEIGAVNTTNAIAQKMAVSADNDGETVYGINMSVDAGTGTLSAGHRNAYGIYNVVTNNADYDAGWNYGPNVYGLYNKLVADVNQSNYRNVYGVMNAMDTYTGSATEVYGDSNVLMIGGANSGGMGSYSNVFLKNSDGISQYGRSYMANAGAAGANDIYTGLLVWDGSITGGTGYGVKIEMNDADWTNKWAFYSTPESGPSYFGGNVGIGTTAPGALLDLGLAGTTLGTMRLEGNASGYVQIQPSAAAGSWTLALPENDGDSGQFLQTNGSGVTSWAGVSAIDHGGLGGLSDDDHTIYALLAGRSGGQILIGGTGTTDDLTLQTTSGVGESGADMYFKVGNNGATEALTILNSGNVGIGTTAPTHKLHVEDTNSDVLFKSTGTDSYSRINLRNDTITWDIRTDTDDKFKIKDWSSGTDRFAIDVSGNVGIGTTAPGTKLDVVGSFRSTDSSGHYIQFRKVAGGEGEIITDENAFNFQPANGMAYVYKPGVQNYWRVYGGAGGENWIQMTHDSSIGTLSTGVGNLILSPAAGNVGIGTTNPLSKLHLVETRDDTVAGSYLTSNLEIDLNPSLDQPTNTYTTGSVIDVDLIGDYYKYFVTGAENTVYNQGAGDAGYLLGSYSSAGNASADVYMIRGGADYASSAGGATTYMIGQDIYAGALSGTVQSMNGAWISTYIDNTDTTVTNRYGLYITSSGTATNDYGIYVDSPAKNYFAGSVSVGMTDPVAKGYIGTNLNDPHAVFVSGDNAFAVSYANDTLAIYDISDPANPAAKGTITTNLDGPRSVYVSGKYAYVASSLNSRLAIYDISNVNSIVAMGYISTNLSTPYSVYVSGPYAYVASYGNDYLAIFDVSNPSSIVARNYINTNIDGPQDVYVAGSYAYVVDYVNYRLAIYDVSNPDGITAKGYTNSGLGNPKSVVVSGNYAYVADYVTGLAVFDISNPDSIVLKDSISTNLAGSLDVYVSGKYAYVASGSNDRLAVFDVSNPADLISKGYTSINLDAPRSVFVSGKYAYLVGTDNDYLSAFEINSLEAPSLFAGSADLANLLVQNNASFNNDISVYGSGQFGGSLNIQREFSAASGNFIVETDGDITAGSAQFTQSDGRPLTLNRLTSDGPMVYIERDGVNKGSISVSGETVSYGAFTGSHYAWSSENIERGMLVSLTGDNKHYHDDPDSEIFYGVAKTTSENDGKVLGVMLGVEDPAKPVGVDNPLLVAAVGNVNLWVIDNGSDIEIGDYLAASNAAGFATKETAGTETGNIVARAYEPVKWVEIGDTLSDGRKIAKISVSMEFDRHDNRLVLDEHGLIASTSTIDFADEADNSLLTVVRSILKSLGLAIQDGAATLKEVIAEKFTAKTARVEQLEMVDKATGEVYCTWVENGTWEKVEGACDDERVDYGDDSQQESPTISGDELNTISGFDDISPANAGDPEVTANGNQGPEQGIPNESEYFPAAAAGMIKGANIDYLKPVAGDNEESNAILPPEVDLESDNGGITFEEEALTQETEPVLNNVEQPVVSEGGEG